jgi:hypothetical protein
MVCIKIHHFNLHKVRMNHVLLILIQHTASDPSTWNFPLDQQETDTTNCTWKEWRSMPIFMQRSCIQCIPAYLGKKQFSFPILHDIWEKFVPWNFNKNIVTNATQQHLQDVPISGAYIFWTTVFLMLIYKQCLTNDCLLVIIGTASLQDIQLTHLKNYQKY